MMEWVCEQGRRLVITHVERHDRNLIGAAAEPFEATPADMRAEDWEVLVWRILPGAGGKCGVFSSIAEMTDEPGGGA